MPTQSREVRLAARPLGAPTLHDFAFAEVELADPGPGHVLVRNRFMSIDPYMRGRMREGRSYVPPFEVGVALTGRATGEVIVSNDPSLAPGQLVASDFGWRDAFVAPVKALVPIDTTTVSETAHLSVLGATGFTAWLGVEQILRLVPGENVFVTGAAGAVGSVFVQLAKRRGCVVVASAGSDRKVAYLMDELGADGAFDYHLEKPSTALRRLAPHGIDACFDNVGGEHLEAAIAAMRDFGRIALCGAISTYNASAPIPGPANLSLAIGRRLRLQGFIVLDHFADYGAFLREVTPLVASGELVNRETIVEGLDAAPAALIDMLGSDEHIGKALVRLT